MARQAKTKVRGDSAHLQIQACMAHSAHSIGNSIRSDAGKAHRFALSYLHTIATQQPPVNGRIHASKQLILILNSASSTSFRTEPAVILDFESQEQHS